IVLVGSNAAWCHPILFQRMLAAREKRGTKIVVIDPRRTASAEMADLQGALLARAAGMAKPGGTVIYATCSIEPEEGEEQAARVALAPDPICAEELPTGLAPAPQGWLRSDPGMLAEAGGLDGFFVARFRA
ncbi:MAG TPA: molybdopterin-dependent oxidoreductase, partial [Novosphingobium sp.]|nr:molybdopterin-dependent oxidoreductase [Novosphingobium sp.]